MIGMGWPCGENVRWKDCEESVSGKPRGKKEARKTKVKMSGLCWGWPENIGSEEMEENAEEPEEWAIMLKEAVVKL
jgi:hypothetical protein